MWKKLIKELKLTDSYISMGLGLLVVTIVAVLFFNYLQGKNKPMITETAEQTTQEEQTQKENQLPTTHTVGSNENLWTIAEKYYQSGYNWVDIAKANNLDNANLIEVGQQLTIPQATPILLAEKTEQAETTKDNNIPDTYTVKPGDTLWDIAVNIYQNGYRWVDIAQANKLANPNLIHSGNVLVLPK